MLFDKFNFDKYELDFYGQTRKKASEYPAEYMQYVQLIISTNLLSTQIELVNKIDNLISALEANTRIKH